MVEIEIKDIGHNSLTDKEILHLSDRNWNENKDNLLFTWKERANKYIVMNDKSAIYYQSKQSFLNTQIIILMGIATAGNCSAETLTQLDMSKKWINLTIGLINTLCVVLEGVLNYNQYASKKELHKKAKTNWVNYITKLEVTEALLYEEREDSKLFLINCRNQYTDLVSNNPIIPENILYGKI